MKNFSISWLVYSTLLTLCPREHKPTLMHWRILRSNVSNDTRHLQHHCTDVHRQNHKEIAWWCLVFDDMLCVLYSTWYQAHDNATTRGLQFLPCWDMPSTTSSKRGFLWQEQSSLPTYIFVITGRKNSFPCLTSIFEEFRVCSPDCERNCHYDCMFLFPRLSTWTITKSID